MSLRENLMLKLQEAGLGSIATELVNLSKEAIRLHRTPVSDNVIPVGSSKLGGHPDVPPGLAWPQWKTGNLIFVMQLNLAEPPPNELLPSTGVLSFFYDCEQSAWGFDPLHKDGFRLWYFPEVSELRRSPAPKHSTFPSAQLSFEPFLSLPDPCVEAIKDLLLELDDDEEYVAFFEENLGPQPFHHVLGWPRLIQNEMELKCQLVTNGLYAGNASGYNDPRRKDLEPGAADWILLLQIDSDDDLDMMWGDVGTLYVWIRRQDLVSRAFDKAWNILQCY